MPPKFENLNPEQPLLVTGNGLGVVATYRKDRLIHFVAGLPRTRNCRLRTL